MKVLRIFTKDTSYETVQEKPFPKKNVLIICCVITSVAMAVNSIFAFLGFMIEDFHLATSREEIGK
jgi:hypothetical protein